MEECLPTVRRAVGRAARDEEDALWAEGEVLERLHGEWPRLLRRYEEARARAVAGFRVWLAVVARNMAVDALRARYGRATTPRAVARMEAWRQRLWRLAVVEERALSEVREELVREGLFGGGLEELAAAVQALEAELPGSARRRARPRVRAGGSGGAEGGRPLEPPAPGEDEPGAVALRRDAGAALGAAVATLSPEERFLLRTYYLEGATAAEVAALGGLRSADRVYERVRTMMRRLRREAERRGLAADDLGRLGEFDWEAALRPSDPEEGTTP